MSAWQDITIAPRDGTPILGLDPSKDKLNKRYIVTWWNDFDLRSIAGAAYLLGDGPRGSFQYIENGCICSWKPTMFLPIPLQEVQP